MALDLIKLNTEQKTQQDAVVIVLDYSSDDEEKQFLRYRMESQFCDSREYMILDGKDIHTGEEILNALIQKKRKYTVYLPGSNRLILFFYLPIDKLTKEWMASYHSIAEYIDNEFPARAGQHLYIPCFYYAKGRTQKPDKTVVAECMLECDKTGTMFAHTQYLLYCGFADKLDSQVQAMVWLLHMWSRTGYFRASVMDPFEHSLRSKLRVINGADYDENEGNRCQDEIDAIDKWVGSYADSSLLSLITKLKNLTDGARSELEKELKEFQERIGLYPAKKDDYTSGGLFRKCERLITADHPLLVKRKLQSVRSIADKYINMPDKKAYEEIVRYIVEELHYPDLGILSKMLDSDSPYEKSPLYHKLMERILGSVSVDAEVKNYIERWYDQIEVLLKRSVSEMKPPVGKGKTEEMAVYMNTVLNPIEKSEETPMRWYELERIDKEFKRAQLIERKEQAGRYVHLSECLGRIAQDTSFLIPTAIIPQGRETLMYVAGKCLEEWSDLKHDVRDVDACIAYYDIAPCQVVVIQTGDLFGFDDGTMDYNLDMIF